MNAHDARSKRQLIGHATKSELRQALTSGSVPARFEANSNGGGLDLAAAIAPAIGPLVTASVDEDKVREAHFR